MWNFSRMAAGALVLALLTACAAPVQQPVPMAGSAFQKQGTRVGIAMQALPKADTSFPGAGCLLCLAAASVANSSLTKHAQTLPTNDLNRVRDELAQELRKKGHEVVLLPDTFKSGDLPSADGGPNKARRDFSAVAKQYNIDKLVVIEIAEIGITRNYSAYVPTGDPQAVVSGKAFLVNLADNSYDWYLPLRTLKSATGAWDEAPSYPGLSNAYYQAIESTYDALMKPFSAQ